MRHRRNPRAEEEEGSSLVRGVRKAWVFSVGLGRVGLNSLRFLLRRLHAHVEYSACHALHLLPVTGRAVTVSDSELLAMTRQLPENFPHLVIFVSLSKGISGDLCECSTQQRACAWKSIMSADFET